MTNSVFSSLLPAERVLHLPSVPVPVLLWLLPAGNRRFVVSLSGGWKSHTPSIGDASSCKSQKPPPPAAEPGSVQCFPLVMVRSEACVWEDWSQISSEGGRSVQEPGPHSN